MIKQIILFLLISPFLLSGQVDLIHEHSWSKNDSIVKVIVSKELPKNKLETDKVFIKGINNDTLKFYHTKGINETYIFKAESRFENYLKMLDDDLSMPPTFLKDSLGRCIEKIDSSNSSFTRETFSYTKGVIVKIGYVKSLNQLIPTFKIVYEYSNNLLVKINVYNFMINEWSKSRDVYYMYDSSGLVQRSIEVYSSGEKFSKMYTYVFH